jgi:predicted  nucleic acid-binding Zn-ribbon protein
MSALQKLQEKIEQWKLNHEEIKKQNADLKSQLAGVAGAQKEKESLAIEVEAKATQCTLLEETVTTLRRELEEKDAEIEKIIAQVETLLA